MTDTNLPTHFATPPTKTTVQHDYILLDGSGSMRTKWFDTMTAIEAYVSTVRAEGVRSHIKMQIFDSGSLDYMARDCSIDDWKSLTQEPVGAYWGMTPLYDAIAIMGRRLRDLDPPRASIVIVTDGDENNSTFTDLTQAKAILDWCRAKGWQITFIGANFNNWKQAEALGANERTSIGVAQKHLVDATTALAKKRARYGLYGEQMHYTDDEKQKFGGFLGGPSNGNGNGES